MTRYSVYDSAPQYRIEERQSPGKCGPVIVWSDDLQHATDYAENHARLAGNADIHGLWFSVVNKDTGELYAQFES